jgi:hypothetical protein
MKPFHTSALVVFCLALISLTACSGKKELKTLTAVNADSLENNKSRFDGLPPVGPPTYATGMVGVQSKVSSVRRSGGEVFFDIEVLKILGSGAAAQKPSIGQKMSLSYPDGPKTMESAKKLQDGATIKMTLSFTPSITEGGGQWSCEKVHVTD